MAAGDFFVEVGDPGSATTLSAPGYTTGGTSINVGSTTNWPSTGKAVVFAIDEAEVVDGEEVQVAGTYNEFEGVVASATSISNVDWKRGSGDRNYSAGSLTRVYIPVSAERENRLITGITTHADQDGTLKAGAVDVAAVITDSIITNAKMATDVKPYTLFDETTFDFVASGCVWSGDSYGSTRAASMTSGVVYINGQRVAVSSVSARTFTASRDTYIDVGTDGVVDYNEVTNNNTSPALAADHIRIGIIVTGASSIANAGSVNQGQEDKVLPIASSIPYSVTDSLGNLICPRDPMRRTLGYRQRTSNKTTTSTSAVLIDELSTPVIVPTGRKIRATLYTTSLSNNTSTQYAELTVYEGATSGTLTTVKNKASFRSSAANDTAGQVVIAEWTPTSSTIFVSGALNAAGSGTAQAVGAATTPCYLKVELV